MNAIHVNITSPFFAKNGINAVYRVDKFDLYNTILSALLWRKNNGKISLICDETAYLFYKNLGIEKIWDDVLDILPKDIKKSENINPKMFWAAGKLLALREISSPVAVIDTDFIVWKKLSLKNLTVTHYEDLYEDVYPSANYFNMTNGYIINPNWDLSVNPCNTSFLYIPDEDFKQFYVAQSLDFMKSALDCDDYLRYMVFAEQRLLSICAKSLNIKIDTLLDKDKIFSPQDSFTHLWGAKQIMRDNKEQAEIFCQRAKNRILNDFPEYSYLTEILDKYN